MNRDMLLDAIGEIDDTYIAAAQRSAALLSPRPSGVPAAGSRLSGMPHRAALTAAAIVILLLSSFTAAMASNEDFRNAVFRFFRISTPEAVLPLEDEPAPSDTLPPDAAGHTLEGEEATTAEIEDIGSACIEDAVSVDYLRIDGIFDFCQGAVYLYEPWEGYDDTYDAQTRYAAAAYGVADGQMIPLEAHREAVSYTWAGETWQIRFDWYERDGILYTNAKNHDIASSMEWEVSAVAGNSDFLLLTLGFGQQIEYTQYPLLYNVRTKELLDFLAKCQLPEGQRITHADLSPNLSKALITCDNGAAVYCYDTRTETLFSLKELSGLEEPEASFLDDDTICCLSIDENGLYHCRTLAMPSGECTVGFSGLPGLAEDASGGLALTGGRFALYVDEERNCFVYDFKTGDHSAVNDFKYPTGDIFLTMNSAEDKILFIQEAPEADGLGISQIGVLDLASRTFVLFDREGYETRREISVGWFDNDRVAVRADVEGCGYLYLYTVESP